MVENGLSLGSDLLKEDPILIVDYDGGGVGVTILGFHVVTVFG
jgi:hypothetical protein